LVGKDPSGIGRRAYAVREVETPCVLFCISSESAVAIFVQVTVRYLPLEDFTDQKLTNDLCLSVRYIFFKDRIDKKENKLNHKWTEGKSLEKNGL
jgi:hypothetical protein